MLTKAALSRFTLAFTLITVFCLMPYDWNVKPRNFTYTKWKYRRICHKFLLLLMCTIIPWMVLNYFYDIYNSNLRVEEVFIIGMYLLMFILALTIALIVAFNGKDLIAIWNNVFYLDTIYYKENILNPVQLQQIEFNREQSKESPTVRISSLIEPASFIHSICMCILFAQSEIDPWRRYLYKYIVPIEFQHTEPTETFALVLYLGAIRLIYGYFCLLVFLSSVYLEHTNFWLKQLNDCKDIMDSNVVRKIYSIESTFNAIMNKVIGILLPSVVVIAFCIIVVGLYGTVQLVGHINWFTWAFFPTFSIFLLIFLQFWFIQGQNLQSLSEEFIMKWEKKKIGGNNRSQGHGPRLTPESVHVNQHNHDHNKHGENQIQQHPTAVYLKTAADHELEFQKYLVSRRRLHFSVLGIFNCTRRSFTSFVDQILDKTVTLILNS